MIIIPDLVQDILKLHAFSYQDAEINILNLFLEESNIQFERHQINPDKHGRKGVSFHIDGISKIERLESILGIRFIRAQNTQVEFKGGAGTPYRCIRIAHLPWIKGCETIIANDDHAAFVKCSLLARKKNWFGGKSEQGTCKK